MEKKDSAIVLDLGHKGDHDIAKPVRKELTNLQAYLGEEGS